jgi:hypothetical protein
MLCGAAKPSAAAAPFWFPGVSEQQAARIEELLAGLNTSHSTLKDMVTS